MQFQNLIHSLNIPLCIQYCKYNLDFENFCHKFQFQISIYIYRRLLLLLNTVNQGNLMFDGNYSSNNDRNLIFSQHIFIYITILLHLYGHDNYLYRYDHISSLYYISIHISHFNQNIKYSELGFCHMHRSYQLVLNKLDNLHSGKLDYINVHIQVFCCNLTCIRVFLHILKEG